MRTREIGNGRVGRTEVGAIGLGLMTFDQTGTQPREQLLDTVRAALDAGVTLFDTADAYGPGDELGAAAQGENERLVAGLLDELGVRDRVLLATKGGHVRTEGGGWATDSTPEHLWDAVDASLKRLGVDQIALWQHHRPDPDVPYDEVIGTLADIHESGKVRMIGLSNADRDQIRAAHDVLGDALVSVQNQFSPKFRSSRPEIDLCAELGLAFLPWSPLGGLSDAKELAEQHPAFAAVAGERGISAQQVALAWSLAQSPVVVPIPGAKRPESVRDSAAAADLELTFEELLRLDADEHDA
ncbi:aldo/keto reductase [Nocardioides taihuensis]|uniref:Aldo/keto reductase n=1 Tax=Nocardioides taihuensis TaxID=1835606 RepID=A0ABW0BIJ8_9ACTN